MANFNTTQLKKAAQTMVKVVDEMAQLSLHKLEGDGWFDRVNNFLLDTSTPRSRAILVEDGPGFDILKRILNPESREEAFRELANDVEFAQTQTRVLVACYDQATQRFDRRRFDSENGFFDFEIDLKIKNLFRVINQLNRLYLADRANEEQRQVED